jgi:hypothetical protein
MKEILEFADFVVDLVCMMPPLDTSELSLFPQWLPIAACLAAVSFLVFLFIWHVTKEIIGGNSERAFIVAFCVAAIAFLSLGHRALYSIIQTLYPALVLLLRAGEGALLGLALRSRIRPWHLILLIIMVTGLYLLLLAAPIRFISIAKALWAVAGASIASFTWAIQLNKDPVSFFHGRASGSALFLMFLSTLLFVQTSPILRFFFQWVFPAGVVIGVFFANKIHD